jgi:hypothetical protein
VAATPAEGSGTPSTHIRPGRGVTALPPQNPVNNGADSATIIANLKREIATIKQVVADLTAKLDALTSQQSVDPSGEWIAVTAVTAKPSTCTTVATVASHAMVTEDHYKPLLPASPRVRGGGNARYTASPGSPRDAPRCKKTRRSESIIEQSSDVHMETYEEDPDDEDLVSIESIRSPPRVQAQNHNSFAPLLDDEDVQSDDEDEDEDEESKVHNAMRALKLQHIPRTSQDGPGMPL